MLAATVLNGEEAMWTRFPFHRSQLAMSWRPISYLVLAMSGLRKGMNSSHREEACVHTKASTDRSTGSDR